MGFKRTITIVAAVLLIIIFVFMIFFLKRSGDDVVFPPVISKCPDYWDHEQRGDGGDVCKNTFGMKKDVGDNTGIRDKALSDFDTGSRGKCGKQKWSRENGLTWDGITNSTKLDCSEH
jgi:hypothetical protein